MTNPAPDDTARALHLLEAAGFLRDAHRDGLSVQEIGTALRHMADGADPRVGSLHRDGFGLDEIATMLAAPRPPAGQAAELEQEVRRLRLMVDEYGAGASALTDKLKRVRDLHRETCILATGKVPPTAFTCGMCEVLDTPAAAVLTAPVDRDDEELTATTCSAQYHGHGEPPRLCIRAAQHMGKAHTDENGMHWSDTVAVYPLADGTLRTSPGMDVLRRMAEAPQPETQAAMSCTCAVGGDCFVPAGHHADCPDAAPAVVAQPGKEA
jgi:hypothetical protein